MKKCEVCLTTIPDDYQVPLCLSCYQKNEAEQLAKKAQEEEEKAERQLDATLPQTTPTEPNEAIKGGFYNEGITDPSYQTNPEAEDKEQWQTNITQFSKTGVLLWHVTRDMYEFIKNYCLGKVQTHPQWLQGHKFIWRPKIVDVGSGIGVGSNILSNEADFVWGIDKNEMSVKFAKQAFERVKNGIYYSSQVSFDHVDFMKDTREFLKFDLVVAIEVLEHIEKAGEFIERLIAKFAKRDKTGNYNVPDPTEFFISTPNRNNAHIGKDKPTNKYHVREVNSTEYYNFLMKYFGEVKFHNSQGEPVPVETTHTPILALCKFPKQ